MVALPEIPEIDAIFIFFNGKAICYRFEPMSSFLQKSEVAGLH
jgi:hypothetical protein